jgi:hypothetical protein
MIRALASACWIATVVACGCQVTAQRPPQVKAKEWRGYLCQTRWRVPPPTVNSRQPAGPTGEALCALGKQPGKAGDENEPRTSPAVEMTAEKRREAVPEQPALESNRQPIRLVSARPAEEPQSFPESLKPKAPRSIPEPVVSCPAGTRVGEPPVRGSPPGELLPLIPSSVEPEAGNAIVSPPAPALLPAVAKHGALNLPGKGQKGGPAARREKSSGAEAEALRAAATPATGPPAPAPEAGPSRQPAMPVGESGNSPVRSSTTSLGQILGTGSVVLAALLLHLVGLSVVLRRCEQRISRRLRAQLASGQAAGAPPAVPVGLSPPKPGPTGEAIAATTAWEAAGGEPAAAPADEAVAATGESFDLGPTYEEELRQRQEEERQKEEGLLRHLFEDNVRLFEQIGQLTAETA